jgi:hypothetical protein
LYAVLDAGIFANNEYEMALVSVTAYLSGWAACLKGPLSNSSSNLPRSILGISLQAMQQLTSINFIFYSEFAVDISGYTQRLYE